jgi:hypothetical protein
VTRYDLREFTGIYALVISPGTRVFVVAALCGVGLIRGVAFGQETTESATGAKALPPAGAEGPPAAGAESPPAAGAETSPAAGAERPSATGADTAPAVDDEIIVRGQTRADLRLRIQMAEEAVYDRFNEINSNDEFDIHCRQEMLTGSNISRRVCQANFWRDAQSRAGEETVRALQGSYSLNAQQFLAEAIYKRRLLNQEMRRLATEDPELGQALARLGTLEQAIDTGKLPQALSKTASVEKTSGAQALPYGAALEADVRIGRQPWKHPLTQRTFTIANVHGKITSIGVECHGKKERLTYDAGVEWTLPDEWGACTVAVEAPTSTTFSLYEFE